MSKRFTDSKKWDDPWFDNLSTIMKLAWVYLCDQCDGVGIWKINEKLLRFHIDPSIKIQDVLQQMGKRVVVLDDEKLWIPKFIEFQYKTLNPANRAQFGIMKRLIIETENIALDERTTRLISTFKNQIENYDPQQRVNRPPPEGQPTLQEKEKEKDKGSNSFLGKGDARGKTLLSPDPAIEAELERLYAKYPRRGTGVNMGRKGGMIAARKKFKTLDELKLLAQAVENIATANASAVRQNKTYPVGETVPMWSSFISKYEDWLSESLESPATNASAGWDKF